MNENSSILHQRNEDKPSLFAGANRKRFLIAWLVPFFVFVATSLIWTYAFFSAASFCVLWSLLGASISCILIVTPLKPWTRPTGIGCLLAFIFASVVGLYLYDSFAIFPKFYGNTRKYTNVVPAEPAGAVADAGKIVFTRESYVDVTQSIGYIMEDGVTYCAAPIRDGSGIERMEFWAVGVGCCSAKGEFYCDAAGDSSAHSGIVVFDNNGYFNEARFDYYEKARRKAEAEYSLQSVFMPVYVRWVKESNLDMLSNQYRDKAILFQVIFCVLWLGISAALAIFLLRSRPAKRGNP